MSLHSDLLEQARRLATNEPRRPKQASLRRAISAAYYSLFHLLVWEGCLVMLGSSQARRRARSVLERSFEHTTMAQCCKSFESGVLPAKMSAFSPPNPPSAELRFVAQTFVELQEQRHRADYDTYVLFQRAVASNLVDKAVDAATVWNTIRRSDEAVSFLLCLLFWKTLRER